MITLHVVVVISTVS